MNNHNLGFVRKGLTIGLSLVAAFAAQAGLAQSSTSAIAVELAGNASTANVTLADQSTNGSTATVAVNQSFSGMDGNNQNQTMIFTGSTTASADYGRLHVYTTGTLTNSYYNANNPLYVDNSGNVANANGSPDDLASLGFAFFNDTLQYGGALQAGYQAIYVFHVDGTNSGTGGAADLGFTADGVNQGFFDFNNGYLSTDWVTQGFNVNGITPQQVNVQFSDQVVFNTPGNDGMSFAGTSDFSETLSLTGIVLEDAQGNIIPTSQWTVTSGSGTVYSQLNAVPEPASMLFLGLLALPFVLRKSSK
jgi:hypothetical protein